jgi:N-methylhydantoinase B
MMMAGDEGGNTLITFAGTRRDGSPWVFSDIHLGTWGGRQELDGVDGISSICVSTTNSPCEIVELEYPLIVQQYGYVRDAYGPGKYRGGLGLVREYRALTDRTVVQVRSDRKTSLPFGLSGGKPGTPTSNVINPGPTERQMPSKFTALLNAGDVFRTQLPGAGGWGDPLDRDPAAVVRDIRNEKTSVEFAAREHGVKVYRDTLELDAVGTDDLRASLARTPGCEPATSPGPP